MALITSGCVPSSPIHSASAAGLEEAEAGIYAGYTADAVYAYAHALQAMVQAGIDVGRDTTQLRDYLQVRLQLDLESRISISLVLDNLLTIFVDRLVHYSSSGSSSGS